ncbi:MAG TPA: lipoate--protein ligase family protein [Candidatus Methanomethylophilaceae archaeon]|nr:lipoate--protein ligase family protein [Candidatus Methanomethylophilaceae archaeon]
MTASRFIDLGSVPPEYGAAADAVIFDEVSEGRSPATIHVYSRNAATISLGRFRDPDSDVRRDVAERMGFPSVRRISGGSTIFTGTSQIIYSITMEDVFPSKRDSYSEICTCVASALGSLGIKAEYKQPNDVLVNGRKISGSAQYRAKGFLLQHGTLLTEPEPLIDEVLFSVKDRSYPGTVSISECLGRTVPRDHIVDAIRKSFIEGLGLDLKSCILSDMERDSISLRSGSFKV